jgi:hypothetical protein
MSEMNAPAIRGPSMARERLFREVVIALACYDVLWLAVLRAIPAFDGTYGAGRILICLGAGYIGARSLTMKQAVPAVFSGSVAETILLLIVIAAGKLMPAGSGPALIVSMLMVHLAIAATAPLAGASLGVLHRRLSQRAAG